VTGILLLDKPEGITSAGAIRALKPHLGSTKVGHLGTLDPFASGLLPLCLGEATKVARYLLLERKTYSGAIVLGAATDTLDRTGRVTETAPLPALTADAIDGVVRRFLGRQEQVPPMYSALKRGGVPLYKLARQGVEVERAGRQIEIEALTLAAVAPDRIDFLVTCSKGTYVRVLAADIGKALGTVAHLDRLRRLDVGPFRIDDAHQLAALESLPPGSALPLLPVRAALGDYAAYAAPAEGLARLRHGQQDPLARLPAPRRAGETALVLDPAGNVAAVIEAAGTAVPAWRLVRLLAT
jgi:tRNA pseudouridine55 synthase